MLTKKRPTNPALTCTTFYFQSVTENVTEPPKTIDTSIMVIVNYSLCIIFGIIFSIEAPGKGINDIQEVNTIMALGWTNKVHLMRI